MEKLEYDINSQAPANVENPTAVTPDSKMGIQPDQYQDLANLISQVAGATPYKGVQGAAQVLSPNYFTPDMNQPIQVGQFSGPLGTMPLFSAGIPMFSPAVLQQADEELKEAKRRQYVEALKDAENLGKAFKIVHINDDMKDRYFGDFQVRLFENKIGELSREYGANAYKKGIGKINQTIAQVASLKDLFDNTYKDMKDILSANAIGKESETGAYVSEAALKAANEFKDMTMSEDFYKMDIEQMYKTVADYRKKFIKANALEEAVKPVRTALNDMTIEDLDKIGIVKTTSGENLYSIPQLKGKAAYEAMEDVAKRAYNDYFTQVYDEQYGKIGNVYGTQYVPTKEQFIKHALAGVKWEQTNIFKELSKHKPESKSGDGNKPKYSYLPTADVTLGSGGDNPKRFTVTDVTTFGIPIKYETKGNVAGVEIRRGEYKNIQNQSAVIDRVFNNGGYSWVSFTGDSGFEYIQPLTTEIKGTIKSNIPNLDMSSYKALQNTKDIEAANRAMVIWAANPAQTPAPAKNTQKQNANKNTSGITWE